MSGPIGIRPAARQRVNLRLSIFGPSGAGKTMTALRIATGMTHIHPGKIGLIDSELGSSELYADRWPFDVLHVPDHTTDTYISAIQEFARAGYEYLIIDSFSHPWEWLKTWVDTLAQAKYRGNTWAAWNEGTPKQSALLNAILTYPGHVIATMRSKTEWSVDKNNSNKPVRVGLSPQQRPGSEYEWTLLFELSVDHILTCIKDRSGKFQDVMITKPGEDLGAEIATWLQEGADPLPLVLPPTEVTVPAQPDALAAIAQLLIAIGLTREHASRRLPFLSWLLDRPLSNITEVTAAEAERLHARLSDVGRGVELLDEWRAAMTPPQEPAVEPPPPPLKPPARQRGKGKSTRAAKL